MKHMVAAIWMATCICGCATKLPNAPNPTSSETLTVIRYSSDPLRTFEIVGTDTQGVTVDELADVLRRRQSEHPEAVYEMVAELKCVPTRSDNIITTIRATGIHLKHYWAPVSFDTPDGPTSRYGPGFIDILK